MSAAASSWRRSFGQRFAPVGSGKLANLARSSIGGLFKRCRIRKLSEQLRGNLGIIGKIHSRKAEYGARIAALQRRDLSLELRSLAIILTQLRDRQKIVFKGAALKNPKQADRMAFLLRQPFQGQLQRGDQAFRRSFRQDARRHLFMEDGFQAFPQRLRRSGF